MLVGVDLDNTIVCYERLFSLVARERGLIPVDAGSILSKTGVRARLNESGREEAWTELQGVVYGERMREAPAFPGAVKFFTRCRQSGVPVCIISHRTRSPIQGAHCDLHRAAFDWLEGHGFFGPALIGMSRDDVHLVATRGEKLRHIAEAGCSHFVEDLPDILGDAGFPAGVERILFDPGGAHLADRRFRHATSWMEVQAAMLPTGDDGAVRRVSIAAGSRL
jgi:hypothetical protein